MFVRLPNAPHGVAVPLKFHRRRNLRIAAALATAAMTAASRGGTTANWLSSVSGSWTDATKWSTQPVFPNNGSPTASDSYDVVVGAAGASYAVWNTDTKMLTVKYAGAANKIKIEEAIAGAGYDTPDVKATEDAYNKLDECCQYERATVAAKSCCDSEACTKSACMKDGKCTKEAACCKEAGCDQKECCKKA